MVETKSRKVKLRWFDKRRIRDLWAEGFSAIELAQMYNVTKEHIYYINRGIKRPKRI